MNGINLGRIKRLLELWIRNLEVKRKMAGLRHPRRPVWMA